VAWKKIGGPAHSLAVFGNNLAALTPDRSAVYLRDPAAATWKEIGGPAASLVGGAWDLYALAPDASEVWRYDGATWIKIGGPGAQFVGICNALYALTPDKSKVVRFDRNSGKWAQIGGPAKTLVGGGSKLYATSPSDGTIWEYSRFDRAWTKIGGAGAMFVGVGGTVYGLAPDKSAVFKYSGTPESWTKVGGPAQTLIGGGSDLFALQPGALNLWRYRGTGDQWDQVGTPGTGFVCVGRTIYGMTTDKSEVYELDEANAETQRLRKLLYAVYNETAFGRRVVRGFLVKRLAGTTLAELNADVCFQPLSTLKLLPYLHALVEVDKGSASMDTTKVSWVAPTTGTPAEKSDTTCLSTSAPNTVTGSAPLEDALPTMMWESHNRTLDAVLNKYGPVNITRRAQSLGLRQTEMYFGCPQPGGPEQPWADNVSTLADFARIFEGVEALDHVAAASTRQAFRDNMIVLDAAPGTSYTSPITGRMSGPWSNEFLRPIVEREADSAKLGIVPAFMKEVVVRGKGGSGGPSGTEWGNSDFLEVSLPFKGATGRITLKKFVVGWYVYQMRGTTTAAEKQALETFRLEIHAEPIRQALATW
jgi:hypothetical protein